MTMSSNSIKGPRRTYERVKLVQSGDVADIYASSYEPGEPTVVVKTAREAEDNDLIENEATIIGELYPSRAKDEGFYRYLPRLLDTFVTSKRRVNVFPYFKEYVTLEDILKAYPAGIDYRDAAWMYKRLLVGIGFAHLQGVVHGAIVPSHVLVHPIGHGAKIVAWSYALNFAPPAPPDPDPVVDPKPAPKVARSVWDRVHDENLYDEDVPGAKAPTRHTALDPKKAHIKAISVAYEHFYPPEVFAKQTPTPATDIFMAAKCMMALLGGNVETNTWPATVPMQIQAFLSASIMSAPRKRPQDAWDLHDAFDTLLGKLVGPRAYRPFSMPSGWEHTP
jgi:serine/threonine protein kinase